ncbi:MAG: hypothetical protein Q4G08_02930 [Capnocytophaga sp.]|nr:hypothetical protein [Capnocytophaga sp.]
MNVTKVYTIFKVLQDIVTVIMPILETLVKRDLNGDGTVGRKVD